MSGQEDSRSMTALATSHGTGAYVTPLQVLGSLWRHRWFLAAAVAVVVGLSALVLWNLSPSYTARVLLAPEQQQGVLPTQFAGLASMAGLSLGVATEGPQFYAAVLTSRPITDAVLGLGFPTAAGPASDSVTLVDLLEAKGDTDSERLWNATRTLGQRMGVSTDARTGIIALEVTLPSPVTAAAVANQFALELNRFNSEVRQSQARARREFIEARVAEAATQLADSEAATREFLLENRDFENSPRLSFEYQRLQRVMNTHQELYLDLERQLNTARIEEVDDIAAVTTIEHAVPPQRPSRPRRLLWLALATVMSSLVLAGGVVLRDHGRTLFGGVAA